MQAADIEMQQKGVVDCRGEKVEEETRCQSARKGKYVHISACSQNFLDIFQGECSYYLS